MYDRNHYFGFGQMQKPRLADTCISPQEVGNMRKIKKNFLNNDTNKKVSVSEKNNLALNHRYRNWTLVSVPDTKTWFRSYTTCIIRFNFQKPFYNIKDMALLLLGNLSCIVINVSNFQPWFTPFFIYLYRLDGV